LNEWKYLNETDHCYSLADPHYTDDIKKVSRSKVKVTQRWPQILWPSHLLNHELIRFSRSWEQRSR